jgi:hypothetical protein
MFGEKIIHIESIFARFAGFAGFARFARFARFLCVLGRLSRSGVEYVIMLRLITLRWGVVRLIGRAKIELLTAAGWITLGNKLLAHILQVVSEILTSETWRRERAGLAESLGTNCFCAALDPLLTPEALRAAVTL